MRFGIREICNVVFKAKDDMKIGSQSFKMGEPVLYIDTAKTSTLEGATTTVYAQGGQGNSRLIAWEGERTVTFTVEDALLSPVSFSMLSGAGIMEAASSSAPARIHTTYDIPVQWDKDNEKYYVEIVNNSKTDAINMYFDPNKASGFVTPVYATIMDEAGAPVIFVPKVATQVGTTVTSGVVTIAAESSLKLDLQDADGESIVAVGDDEETHAYEGLPVRIDCYLKKTSGITQMSIDATSFSGNFYVEASTLFRQQGTGTDLPAELIFPDVKIQSNFTFNMAATGDPSTFTFTMDAFPGYTKYNKNKKVFCEMQILGEDAVPPLDLS